jgi:hypothetical protein
LEDETPTTWVTLSSSLTAIGSGIAVAGGLVMVNGGIRREGEASAETSVLMVEEDASVTVVRGPTMLHPRAYAATAHHEHWTYTVGGVQTDGTSHASVERIHFDEHDVGEWIEDRPLPEPRSHHALVVHEGALYAIGGLHRSDLYEDEMFADILRAPIQEDGSLGAWTTVGSLPEPLAAHGAFVYLDQFFVLGGLDGASASFVSKVQRATVTPAGAVGEFETLPGELPLNRGYFHMPGGLIYSIGGASYDRATDSLEAQTGTFFARRE